MKNKNLEKSFQVAWPVEVLPDSGSAQRSKMTGDLKIIIPKMKPEPERKSSEVKTSPAKFKRKEKIASRENDEDFIDNDDVLPLLLG